MNVAVITPYYKEPLATLQRCHDSVRRQTHGCTHFFVSDGHPRAELDEWDVRHMRLGTSHGDYGNTPRALGSMSAFNLGFDAVAYLDADNWYADDHVESLVCFSARTGSDVGFSSRHIVLSTGEKFPFPDEPDHQHVDTNCLFFTSRAAFLAPIWAMMDPSLAAIGDRLMFHVIRKRGVSHGWTGLKTLYYESRWAVHFEAMGKEPPEDAHRLNGSSLGGAIDPELSIQRLGFDPF